MNILNRLHSIGIRILAVTILNIPLAVIATVSSEYVQSKAFKKLLQAYALSVVAAGTASEVACISTEILLERQQKAKLKADLEVKQAGAHCSICIYFAGRSSPIRCAVYPIGDANKCSDWQHRLFRTALSNNSGDA